MGERLLQRGMNRGIGPDWLANVPEIPSGKNGHCGCSLNEESNADASDNVPQVRNGLGGPLGLGCNGSRKSRGLSIAF